MSGGGPKYIETNWSHGRPRVELRRPSDGGTPPIPESAESVPMNDENTGRFLPGNRAHRRRQLKASADALSTLNPAKCASWLAPFVRDAIDEGMVLLARYPDPALSRLVSATANAHAMHKGLLVLGASGDVTAAKEARAWLAEYRACHRELAALAGTKGPRRPETPDEYQAALTKRLLGGA